MVATIAGNRHCLHRSHYARRHAAHTISCARLRGQHAASPLPSLPPTLPLRYKAKASQPIVCLIDDGARRRARRHHAASRQRRAQRHAVCYAPLGKTPIIRQPSRITSARSAAKAAVVYAVRYGEGDAVMAPTAQNTTRKYRRADARLSAAAILRQEAYMLAAIARLVQPYKVVGAGRVG